MFHDYEMNFVLSKQNLLYIYTGPKFVYVCEKLLFSELKNLKIVAFQADEVKLTDVTVHFGFLKMTSLKLLTVDMFPVSNASINLYFNFSRLRYIICRILQKGLVKGTQFFNVLNYFYRYLNTASSY